LASDAESDCRRLYALIETRELVEGEGSAQGRDKKQKCEHGIVLPSEVAVRRGFEIRQGDFDTHSASVATGLHGEE
jgi:hypothetical protein